MKSVLIADDHPLILMGIQSVLEKKGFMVCAVCTNSIDAYHQIIRKRPLIAILDMKMPDLNAVEIIKKLESVNLPTRFIIQTSYNEASLFNYAKELGVRGYLLKNFALEEFDACIDAVANGGSYFSIHLNQSLTDNARVTGKDSLEKLSFAERRVLTLVSAQKNNNEIAKELFVTEKTVEKHRSSIIKKLNIEPSQNALLKWALKNVGG